MDDYESPLIYDNLIIAVDEENACIVVQGDKVGAIGPNTNIPCMYKEIKYLSNGYYAVRKEGSNIFLGIAYLYKENKDSFPKFGNNGPPKYSWKIVDKYNNPSITNESFENIYSSENYIVLVPNIPMPFDPDKKISYIYDNKGNKILSVKGHFVIENDLIKFKNNINDERLIDLKTLKNYNSYNEFLTEKNSENQLIEKSFVKFDNNSYGFVITYNRFLDKVLKIFKK